MKETTNFRLLKRSDPMKRNVYRLSVILGTKTGDIKRDLTMTAMDDNEIKEKLKIWMAVTGLRQRMTLNGYEIIKCVGPTPETSQDTCFQGNRNSFKRHTNCSSNLRKVV